MAADTGETDVLAKMDAAAPSFRGLTADISAISYTKVIDDKTEESGTISLLKTKPKELQVLIQFTKPDARSVAFRGRKAEIYYPKIKTVQEYDLGRSGLIEQFLLLGFGTSGKELASAYQVKLVGAEKIGNQEAWHLELFPKSADLKKSLSKLELWISEDGAYAVQQKVTQPSGDYRVFTYRNVKLNPKLSPNDLALKLPSGVKREFPQK
ncbi:MAG TPA: outer membrane lipoprotein carrier protein LolA [Bryobacteraceae bacterium]|jgi:outer membrane lipoprotein-sorting protein|nr:outer membrane lipoprotein carrier protein LolA [Bryobacteraceae bacterium]